MRILATLSLLIFALLSAVHAAPPPDQNHGDGYNGNHDCLSDQEAKTLLYQFISLFEKFDVNVAERILSPDFQYLSSSTNFLVGLPYNVPTNPNRTAFIAGEEAGANNPNSEVFTVLDWIHGCKTVWFHWVDNSTPIPLTGFDEFYVEEVKGGNWLIYKDYSEFNNAAALYNAGIFPCPSS